MTKQEASDSFRETVLPYLNAFNRNGKRLQWSYFVTDLRTKGKITDKQKINWDFPKYLK